MRGEVELQLQKINSARRNAIATPEDKMCMEERDYDSQKTNYARRNANMTPKDKLSAEKCNYNSRR